MSWLIGKFSWKCCSADFSSLCHTGRRCLSRGILKRDLSGIQGTNFSESLSSEIFKLWNWSVFSKCTKFYIDSKNGIKISENLYGVWDNGVWTCLWNFSELWQADMWVVVNVLPKCPKISHLTKRDVFLLKLSWFNRKLRWKCCRADFSIVRHPWRRWFSTGVLKREL